MSRRFGSPVSLTPSELALRKKRRYQSLSDEEIQKEMDNRGLPYRFGWPELPPLPVKTIMGALKAVENGAARIEEAQNILRLQRVHVLDIFLAYRLPRDTDTDEDLDGFLTLVVTADTTQPTMFVQAITRIRQCFKIHKPTQDISIEIVDYRAVDDLFTFPIRPSETSIQDAWSEASNVVLSEITARSEKWLCIEAAHRGIIESRCSPTIVVTTPTASSDIWAQVIVPAIRLRLRNITPLFGIEILCGVTLFGAMGSETVTDVSYNKQVGMGASIGIPGDLKHAGTVGGFISLSNGRIYGLTNHYVVRDARIDDLLQSCEENMLRPGNDSLNMQPHYLKSPADCDHEGYLQGLDSQDAVWETQKTKGNTQAEAELKKNEASRNVAKQNPRTFGRLFASSGPRIVKSPEFPTPVGLAQTAGTSAAEFQFLLDWALLDILPPRTVRNELARTDVKLDGTTTQLVKGQFCNTWTPLNVGKTHIKREEVEVAKCGRTTGWTFGTISSVLTKINPDHDATYKEMANVYGLTGSSCGHCHSVIKRGRRSFVDSGDSGSIIVHDPTGTWLGLLFGESAASSGLMIPMAMVINDIENVTGSAVVEPKRDDNP